MQAERERERERESEKEIASAREGIADKNLAIKGQKYRFEFSCNLYAIQRQQRRKMSKKRQIENTENISVDERAEVKNLSKDKKQKLERRMTEKGNDASKSGKQSEEGYNQNTPHITDMKAVKKDSQETNTYNPSTEKSAGISAQR